MKIAAVATILLLIPGLCFAKTVYTLDQAIDAARNKNKAVASAEADEANAKAVTEQVRAGFMPSLDASANYRHDTDVATMQMSVDLPSMLGISVPPQTIKMCDYDNFSAKIQAQQLLFGSGKVWYGHKAAKVGETAAKTGSEAARLSAAQEAAESFYTALLAKKSLETRKEALDRAQSHLDDVKIRYDAGAAGRFDLLRAQVEQVNLQTQVDEAQNLVKLALLTFKRAVGSSPGDDVDVNGTLAAPEVAMSREQARSAAARNNPSLESARLMKSAYQYRELSDRADWLPKVVAFGAYTYQKPYFIQADGLDFLSFGAGIDVPIFDGLSSLSKMNQDKAQQRKASALYSDASDRIDMAIQASLLSMDEAKKRIDNTTTNYGHAQEAVDIAEASYKAGAATNLEVIDAQLSATQAQLAVLKARYDYAVARVRLLAAIGDLN